MVLGSSFRTRPGDRSPARPGHFHVRQITLANLFGVELSESLCRPRGRPGASESPPAQRCLEGGFDLRWPLNPGVRLPLSGAPSGGGGALVSSMVLGPAADASNIRPVTSAPSPPSRCFRSPTAGFRGSYHRRVQRADEVCCNFERRCSFLGFDPPPRSLPGPPVRPRSRRSSARVDRRSLGGPSRSRSPRRPRSRGLLQWSRTVARGRLFEGRGGVPAGFEAAESVPAWGFVHVKERLSRLRRSSRRPVKEWLLPLSR